MLEISVEIREVLDILTNQGYEAYLVGGYVRDAIQHHNTSDIDICTNAKPPVLHELFEHFKPSEVGLDYGVKFNYGESSFEISTMRQEMTYSDQRHPDTVIFIDDIRLDAMRRDFTVNALYYHPDKGLFDFFGGKQDIESKVLRVIGDPLTRLHEDSLRIVRLFRFKSELDYAFDPETISAAYELMDTLHTIHPMQLKEELTRYLCGPSFHVTSHDYPWFLGSLFPEVANMIDYDQQNPYHTMNLYDHSITVTQQLPLTLGHRLVGLFHDTGKVCVQTMDAAGIAHYGGHATASATIAHPYFLEFQFTKEEIAYFTELILNHGLSIQPVLADFQRLIGQYGVAWVYDLITLKRADNLAKSDKAAYQVERCAHFKAIVDTIIDQGLPTTTKDLAINGHDLRDAGVKPHDIGKRLHALLDAVIDGKVLNEKDKLLNMSLEEL
ncbi:CCA tRNA nucleotidyltransferase [Erysipelothrix sp. HDW6C]|uniref:CCA tRNA nucleotidyltransferase n=1 Tax=Erysipelothrix sp. HDW6C TaxID=2714930 RepID=UPI0014094E03|nr:CCA tRNA nucleotidyltransferase [Erysipelothrix sp. HDW6C]QIK70465.1 CCA tRNA nucleotidyltransferase [Erysipelothrix sp. HDW6C]